MRKLIDSIKMKVAVEYARTVAILKSNRGEGFVDNAIAILIAVVIGALLLAGLYALFGETVLPTLKQRIVDMFNYGG
ncbi:DUF6133 family protein [Anaerocolumna aminovalerica]|uniref:DUF6133 family protein n=1 Tax=Anaerocolumna aminovalerica TaxID=1527 RepID=UPI000BE25D06|nr:DUF6133 family protein [Anaerocolumna aminovalerica]